MTTIKSVTAYLESLAPRALQESYDNSGLIVGNPATEITGVLITLDCTEDVIDEAVSKQANLIIAHHPIVFKGLKSLTGKNYVERTIIKAIKHDVAIYAIHTNLDNVNTGVNRRLAETIGLSNISILKPLQNLQKLVVFVPEADSDVVLAAMHQAGAGEIGEYAECSFKVTGKGRFTPGATANPRIGKRQIPEEVIEDRIEVILPSYRSAAIISAMQEAHPYEEVAYYLSELKNYNQETGAGMVGDLPDEMNMNEFLAHLKNTLNLELIRHTSYTEKISRIAICGGSGSFLLQEAKQQGADAFITGDVKYHDFFDAENDLLFCDIGHYESEVGTKELLYDLLTKKFTIFALHLSECVTNPIKYYK